MLQPPHGIFISETVCMSRVLSPLDCCQQLVVKIMILGLQNPLQDGMSSRLCASVLLQTPIRARWENINLKRIISLVHGLECGVCRKNVFRISPKIKSFQAPILMESVVNRRWVSQKRLPASIICWAISAVLTLS